MRLTVGDLRRRHRPTDIAAWWIELPGRHLPWWRNLFLEPGLGWLRWKHDYREWMSYDPPDFEVWAVYPPARRAWFWLRAWLLHPLMAAQGEVGWREFPSWSDAPREERGDIATRTARKRRHKRKVSAA